MSFVNLDLFMAGKADGFFTWKKNIYDNTIDNDKLCCQILSYIFT